jgi:hypothetical protein
MQLLVASGAKVEADEVRAAFRGGHAEMAQQLWEAFPTVNPLELALEAVKSWNSAALRLLLNHTLRTLLPRDLVRLFEGACSSGSYTCGSSVLSFSAAAALHLRSLRPVGVVGRVLCGGLAALKSGRIISFTHGDSIAAEYSNELREWLPQATEVRLVSKHEGRGAASVNAFVAAAKGRARTLTFVETENGGSICGGYLDVAWVDGDYVTDPDRRSFIFTLKNHLGHPPTRFAQKRDEKAAYMRHDDTFYFGFGEGFMVWDDDTELTSDQTYVAPRQGPALFCGGSMRRGYEAEFCAAEFYAARWDLWQVG